MEVKIRTIIMMKHIDETLIERYVHREERLNETEKKAVRDLINESREARALEQMFREFYTIFNSLSTEVPYPVTAFVEKLFTSQAHIIPLLPFRPQIFPLGTRYTTVLAASSAQTQERRFETLTTLASDENGILLRILCERPSNKCRLYLLSNQPEKCAHALVAFPGFMLEFVTDELGRVDFELTEAQSREQWAHAEAILRTPVASCIISVNELKEPITIRLDTGHVISCSYDSGLFSIEQDPSDELQPLTRVVIDEGGKYAYLALQQAVSIHMEHIPEMFTLRFYE